MCELIQPSKDADKARWRITAEMIYACASFFEQAEVWVAIGWRNCARYLILFHDGDPRMISPTALFEGDDLPSFVCQMANNRQVVTEVYDLNHPSPEAALKNGVVDFEPMLKINCAA